MISKKSSKLARFCKVSRVLLRGKRQEPSWRRDDLGKKTSHSFLGIKVKAVLLGHMGGGDREDHLARRGDLIEKG